MYNILSVDSFFKNIEYINTIVTSDEIFPDVSQIIEIKLDNRFSFQNLFFDKKGLYIGKESENSSLFNIEIFPHSGLAILLLNNKPLNFEEDFLKDVLISKFRDEDSTSILYIKRPGRIYANSLELSIKCLQSKGIVAIYSRSIIPFRNDINNTKSIIREVLEQVKK